MIARIAWRRAYLARSGRQSRLHPPGNKKQQVEANGRADDQQDDERILPSGCAVGPCFLRLRWT
jgi:hypothetical protein